MMYSGAGDRIITNIDNKIGYLEFRMYDHRNDH